LGVNDFVAILGLTPSGFSFWENVRRAARTAQGADLMSYSLAAREINLPIEVLEEKQYL